MKTSDSEAVAMNLTPNKKRSAPATRGPPRFYIGRGREPHACIDEAITWECSVSIVKNDAW